MKFFPHPCVKVLFLYCSSFSFYSSFSSFSSSSSFSFSASSGRSEGEEEEEERIVQGQLGTPPELSFVRCGTQGATDE